MRCTEILAAIRFDPRHDYLRVLMQQGRPLTDADWNEQVAMLIEQRWQLIYTLLGNNHGSFDDGFRPTLALETKSLSFEKGTYFVNGLTCRLTNALKEQHPKDLFGALQERFKKAEGQKLSICLDAWEQTTNPVMDQRLIEPTLQGTIPHGVPEFAGKSKCEIT